MKGVESVEPIKHLAIAMTGKTFGPMKMNVDYRLTDLGGRTRLDYLCFCEFRGLFMKLMGTLGGLFVKRQLASFMATLKRLAETKSSTTA